VRSVRSVAAAARRRDAWREAQCRLFDLELDAAMVEVRERLEMARLRKHRHDLVNAFTAVEGAGLIMARESLSASDRSTLAEVLRSGLARFRTLLLSAPEDDHVVLADLAKSLLAEPGGHGAVEVDVSPDLEVRGSPAEITEAVRQLLTQASRRSPETPITLRAQRRGDRIGLWVEDRGPRFTARQRRDLLEPERRSSRPHPVGELDIAFRLAREQGGEVSVEPRIGGGESFGVSWPAHVG
jgi:signal transduction histidine kinase